MDPMSKLALVPPESRDADDPSGSSLDAAMLPRVTFEERFNRGETWQKRPDLCHRCATLALGTRETSRIIAPVMGTPRAIDAKHCFA
jgi:hypothetical protein